MTDHHDFARDLARSRELADAPWWRELYRQAVGPRVGQRDDENASSNVDSVRQAPASRTQAADRRALTRSQRPPDNAAITPIPPTTAS